ncbi:DUF6271 family protein [Streptomyces katrae]|uniref:DUF6271 family protein n=1 Tax=Streptomyces katrae TaxID=68223 RepID=UPI0009A54B9F|nr:DUF6271 family protein [Streptomyces katrae]
MDKICLTLPTNRACADTIEAVGREAAHAARRFGAEVHLLVLDSADRLSFARHARAVRAAGIAPGVVAHHLDEAGQRAFLRAVIDRAGLGAADRVLGLMLPSAVSYGACTNRAFLIAAALGCRSVHRRDSDSRYQELDGEPVFPITHELAFLGRKAADVTASVSEIREITKVTEGPQAVEHADRTVAMVGGSFVGVPSVDLTDLQLRAPDVHREVVGLWAPAAWSGQERDRLVDESFKGAGTEPFTHDHTVLGPVDPMRVDMCNIAFQHEVHERVPLPPATDTIGSDYFLFHLLYHAGLPGVLHNRHIVNFHTDERKTGPGFTAYQTRYAKFVLSMLHFRFLHARMAQLGDSLLDDRHRLRADVVSGLVRESTALDDTENVHRLDTLTRSYRTLGGAYAQTAERLRRQGPRLLAEARADMEDFAHLIDAWPALVQAARTTPLHGKAQP